MCPFHWILYFILECPGSRQKDPFFLWFPMNFLHGFLISRVEDCVCTAPFWSLNDLEWPWVTLNDLDIVFHAHDHRYEFRECFVKARAEESGRFRWILVSILLVHCPWVKLERFVFCFVLSALVGIFVNFSGASVIAEVEECVLAIPSSLGVVLEFLSPWVTLKRLFFVVLAIFGTGMNLDGGWRVRKSKDKFMWFRWLAVLILEVCRRRATSKRLFFLLSSLYFCPGRLEMALGFFDNWGQQASGALLHFFDPWSHDTACGVVRPSKGDSFARPWTLGFRSLSC